MGKTTLIKTIVPNTSATGNKQSDFFFSLVNEYEANNTSISLSRLTRILDMGVG
jgi:tRNA A37 threonylcarbamoyladenosine biosynthesis protein TsaE